MNDVVEKAKTSYDERYKLLKRAKNNEIILDLRRRREIPFYMVGAIHINGYEVKIFLTHFFANRYFEKMIIKYNLKGDE